MRNIYTKAFFNCTSLTDVYCYAENVPNMKDEKENPCTDAFEGSNIKSATLHVPAASVGVYKATAPWSSFKSVVELNIVMARGDANGDGKVDIVDVTMTISYILGQNPAGFNQQAADVTGDGKVDIVDVTSIIDIILKK